MNSDSWKALHSYNPFLTRDRCHSVMQALCAVLLRSVRVSHSNSVLAGVTTLMSLIKRVLKHEVDHAASALTLDLALAHSRSPKDKPRPGIGEEGEQRDFPWPLSEAMKEEALRSSEYDVEEAAVVLQQYQSDLSRTLCAAEEGLQCEKRHPRPAQNYFQLTYLAFHLCEFDVNKTVEMVKRTEVDLLGLAKRGCCYGGRELTVLDEAMLDPAALTCADNEETSEEVAAKLSATLYLLQHTAQRVASQIYAKRAYMEIQEGSQSGEMSSVFDPRFLVFEFVSSFLLRKRQVVLVNDFVRAAREGKSNVQQVPVPSAGVKAASSRQFPLTLPFIELFYSFRNSSG